MLPSGIRSQGVGFGPMVGRLICAWFRIVSFKGTGEWSGPAGANGLAEIAREAATRVVRALTTGISDAGGKQRGLIGETRASAGMLLRTERDAAIPVDRSARALIGNDEVYGGRREDTYTEWFRELHERGVDTDQVMSDLGKLWDYLRHDPKWEIEEPEAANTGQNAAFSVRMLADHGCDIFLAHRGVHPVPRTPGMGDGHEAGFCRRERQACVGRSCRHGHRGCLPGELHEVRQPARCRYSASSEIDRRGHHGRDQTPRRVPR